jgi:hypothetical protein
MIAWIAAKLGVSVLVAELLTGGVIAAAVLFGLRLWGNAQWAKGEREGRLSGAADILKAKQAEWTARQKEIAAAAATAARDKAANEALAATIAADRRSARAVLDHVLAQANRTQEANGAKISLIPGDQLDGALRAKSAELAAAPK